jgi:hypothetical protein
LPSRSYDELVCTAGFLEDGSWIRLYPVPFKFLNLKRFKKYQWIELDVKRRKQRDFRPESYSPAKPDLSDMKLLGEIGTKNYWAERKRLCLKTVYNSLEKLIEDSRAPNNRSLATFRPAKVLDLIIERDERDWKPVWREAKKQLDLFAEDRENKRAFDNMIRKIPYKFKYHIKDTEGRESKMMIEDWEIGALYWNCLADAEGDEKIALEKVRKRYFDEFTIKNDICLFLGTTLQYHQRRMKNPFVIIGVFYPKKDPKSDQLKIRF